MGRQKGSALGLAEMNSDGKPCSGVRGDHEVSTEFFEENQGCFFGLRKISGERCIGSCSPAFFYFVCKKKKSQRDFEIFCSYRHFFHFADSFLRTAGAASKVWLRPSIYASLTSAFSSSFSGRSNRSSICRNRDFTFVRRRFGFFVSMVSG